MKTGAFMGESIGKCSVNNGFGPVNDIIIDSGIKATRSNHINAASEKKQPSGI